MRFRTEPAPGAPEYVDVVDTKTGYRAGFLGHEAADPAARSLNERPSTVGDWAWFDPSGNPVDWHPEAKGL